MAHSTHDVLDIALRMIERHGDRAADLMDSHAHAHRQAGAYEDAEFWGAVAKAIREWRR
jgi:hypothetical protein